MDPRLSANVADVLTNAARGAPASATIAGVRIDALTFDAAVDAVMARASSGPPSYVVTPNAHHVVLLQSDALLREVYENAYLVVADGVPLVWASRALREPLPERVNGTDLLLAVCDRAADAGLRVFLLGGREGAALACSEKLRARHSRLQICGTYCPRFGFENDPAESARVLSAIRIARPDVLFVGLGAPKQEYWMHRHGAELNVPVCLGVGVSFELVAGVVARAPRWMQRAGLEWLFRLGAEPRRLWKRYVFGNAQFCALIARQYAAILRRRFRS